MNEVSNSHVDVSSSTIGARKTRSGAVINNQDIEEEKVEKVENVDEICD